MSGLLYTNIYPIIRFLWRGGREKSLYLSELEQTQRLSRAELKEFQFKKIKNLLKYAYTHVPYYRNLYKRNSIHPDDINTYRDFQALPFLTRDDLNNHIDDLVSDEFVGSVYMSQTGGSVGKPVRFYTDSSSSLYGGAILDRCRLWYDVHPGAKTAWLWGAQRDIPSLTPLDHLRARFKRHRFLNAFDMTDAKMHAFAQMLVRWRPALLRAYPSAISIFAQYINQHGISGIHPKLIETTSEKLMAPQRQLLETVFCCPIAECYSSRELYQIAYQCPIGGLHICEAVYLEVVANDRVILNGQIGEAVITSLTKLAVPFIRYKIDDLANIDSAECSCGRGLPLLKDLVGRKTDYIKTPSGRYVDGRLFNAVFRIKPEILQFQVKQRSLYHLSINIVCKQNPGSAWIENVRKELSDHLGEEMRIELSLVDRIDLGPGGKHHYVTSSVMSESAGK